METTAAAPSAASATRSPARRRAALSIASLSADRIGRSEVRWSGDLRRIYVLHSVAATVEYANGEREYYDLLNDPYELVNAASSLAPARLAAQHDTLTAIASCHDGAGCWAAEHGSERLWERAGLSRVRLRARRHRKTR